MFKSFFIKLFFYPRYRWLSPKRPTNAIDPMKAWHVVAPEKNTVWKKPSVTYTMLGVCYFRRIVVLSTVSLSRHSTSMTKYRSQKRCLEIDERAVLATLTKSSLTSKLTNFYWQKQQSSFPFQLICGFIWAKMAFLNYLELMSILLFGFVSPA